MNKKLFLVAILFVGTIIALSVRAEDLSNCKTVFNGKCIDNLQANPSTNNFNNTKELNTISNVRNTYNKSKQDCRNRYGFWYLMDSYYMTRNKFLVTNIEPNSPAQRAGLRVGDEILKVNENKVNKMDVNMFDAAISPNSITLEIRNNLGKRTIQMSRANVCTPMKEEDELFNTYWKQIYAGEDIEDISLYIQYESRIYSQLSYGYKQYLQNLQNQVAYWQPKKVKFQSGYNSCKAHYMTDSEIHSCISNLVNREISQIQHEEYIRQQQAILQAQQQMQQQQVNALNNYSNALRNQHVNVNGSVEVQHSGTVNVNQNVYGTMYHYNRW